MWHTSLALSGYPYTVVIKATTQTMAQLISIVKSIRFDSNVRSVLQAVLCQPCVWIPCDKHRKTTNDNNKEGESDDSNEEEEEEEMDQNKHQDETQNQNHATTIV
jgi:hypothetical protein